MPEPDKTPPLPHVQTPPQEEPGAFVPLEGGSSIPRVIEALLKTPGRVVYQLHQDHAGRLTRSLLVIMVLGFLAYGLIVGLFSGDTQLWAAPLKMTGGALFAALICLPSLYIFSCLCGADARLGEVWGLLLGAGALSAILLIGFAPAAWVFTVSTNSLPFMGFLHLLLWVVGTWFGLSFLRKGFRYLGGANLSNLGVWSIIFILVSLQMTATLRPLLGTADTFLPQKKAFFLGHWVDVLDGPSRTD